MQLLKVRFRIYTADMRHLRIALFSLVLLLPMHGWAMREKLYEFRVGGVNVQWEGKGPIEMQRHDQGIILTTDAETGAVLTSDDPGFLADAGSVVVSSPRDAELFFAWVLMSDPEARTFAVSIPISAGANQRGAFALTHHRFWKEGKKQIGIILPPHTTILLQSITLQRSNIVEKLFSGLASFWVFDRYRPYTINFLWGPQFEPISSIYDRIYYTQPPTTISWVMIFSICIAFSLGALLLLAPKYGDRRGWIARRVFIVFACIWLLLDLRMGMEFLSWISHDVTTYTMKSADDREFRDRDKFYDFAEFVKPLVADRTDYIFLATYPWPYLGNMRYLTYPALPGISFDRDDTWVIYMRPDIRVSPDMYLLADGVKVAGPGTVLGIFDDSSFVYRTSPAPSPSKKK